MVKEQNSPYVQFIVRFVYLETQAMLGYTMIVRVVLIVFAN